MRQRLKSIRSRLGSVTDTALAAEIDVHRLRVMYYRASFGIPTFVRPTLHMRLSHEQRQIVLAQLQAGSTLTSIIEKTGLTLSSIRPLADSIGWKPQPRIHPPKKNTVGKLKLDDLLTLYDAGVRQSDLARRANVSRERIRQIINRSGRPADHTKKLIQRLERTQKRQADVSRRREIGKAATLKKNRIFLTKANHMWEQQETTRSIATTYDLSMSSMHRWIYTGRKQFGWFARRKQQKR